MAFYAIVRIYQILQSVVLEVARLIAVFNNTLHTIIQLTACNGAFY